MLIAYAIYSPKIKTSSEPITISLLDDKPRTAEKDLTRRQIVQPSEGELAKEAKKRCLPERQNSGNKRRTFRD